MRQIAAVDALRNPVFRRLLLITMIGGLSVGATLTTLGWVVVEESGSPFLVSLVLVTFMAPQMFAGPIGGVLADRYGRARLIRLGISSRAALSLVMAISLFLFPHELAPLFVIATLRAIASGSTIPSRRAFLADIVPQRQLTTALALDEFAITTVFIVGPVITGALLLFLDPGFIFLGLMAISIMGVALVPRAPEKSVRIVEDRVSTERASFLRDLFEGFGHVRRSRILLGVTAISLAAEMLAFNYMILVPVFAKEVFDGGAGLLGLLNGTMPIGELLGSALMAMLVARVARPGRPLIVSVLVAFALGIPLGASSWLPATLVLLVLLGAVAQVFFVMTTALLLRETPPEARARILGLQQVTWGIGALGALMSGALASAFNPHIGVMVPSALGVGIVILVVIASPELRRGGRAIVDGEPLTGTTETSLD